MSTLVSVEAFRAYAGAAVMSVPDALIQQCLDEAESGLLIDVDTSLAEIEAFPEAVALATGEELRRASRLLARRNSPESVLGLGEAAFVMPSRDADSARTIWAIRAVLIVHEGIS